MLNKFRLEIMDGERRVDVIREFTQVGSITNRLNYLPSLELSFPMANEKKIKAWDEVMFYYSDKVFHGMIVDITPDFESNTTTIVINHIIQEWRMKQLPTNRAIKLEPLWEVLQRDEFSPPNWFVQFSPAMRFYRLDYVFSREYQLDALTKVVEMTTHAHWRVNDRIRGRKVEVENFGQDSGIILSAFRTGNGIHGIIDAPRSTGVNFNRVKNVAVVYGQKSDSGMCSISLRDVFKRPEIQLEDFPVEIIRIDANNERNYDYSDDYPSIAPNQNIEYAIRDLHSIEVEGRELEVSLPINSVSPFNIEDAEIRDVDIIKASEVIYHMAVKQLIQLRRYKDMQLTVEELPPTLNVGDKVFVETFTHQNSTPNIIEYNGFKYIKEITTHLTIEGGVYHELVLDDYIRVDRETANRNAIYDVINRNAEKADSNYRHIGNVQLQRQNGTVDIIGAAETSTGTSRRGAEFMISISPDKIYFERFQFRLHIAEPFVPEDTSLELPPGTFVPMSGIVAFGGSTEPDEQATEFTISINGYDITSLIIEEYGSEVWPSESNGRTIGYFPAIRGFFDLLRIASIAPENIAREILSARDNRIILHGNGIFEATYYNYIKYNYTNR